MLKARKAIQRKSIAREPNIPTHLVVCAKPLVAIINKAASGYQKRGRKEEAKEFNDNGGAEEITEACLAG